MKKSTFTFAILIVLSTLFFSCSSEKEIAKTLPQLSTTAATSITLTTASSGGNITTDGGAAVTARGIVWNTATAPTVSLATKTTDGTGTGNFSSAIANLSPSTNYYARAYATNSVGTGYGNEITFTTGAVVLPTLTTSAVSSITSNSAISGGTITADGGGTITARGVVWSTSQNPTITLTTKTSDGTGTGSYTSNLTNLTQNTTYYIRAYATNSAGTVYGKEVSLITSIATVTDICNNTYPTVTVNGQIWMQKNLDVCKYRNGDIIPQVQDPTEWGSLTTGAWCYYNNDTIKGSIYGKLYNWYAVNDPRGLAPEGWHIPSSTEWTLLTNYLGGETIAGGKMKETGTTHWNSPNTSATNSSNFNGIPGGLRYQCGGNGCFVDMGLSAHWWSSNFIFRTSTVFESWGFELRYDNSIGKNNSEVVKQTGKSIRCIKN